MIIQSIIRWPSFSIDLAMRTPSFEPGVGFRMFFYTSERHNDRENKVGRETGKV